MGVAATLLLHFLLFAMVMWGSGSRHHSRLPDAVGAGANSGNAQGTSTERMIVIQLMPEITQSEHEPQAAPQLAISKPQKMLQVTGPDAIPPPPLEFEREGEATEASDADLIARTQLAGLYESQIRARIERAWTPPADSVSESAYASAANYFCRVKIKQKQNGQVEDVKLDKCEGSSEWLDSLVKAIYSASPLPGPPHQSVFVDSFSMLFKGAVQHR